MRRMEYCFCMYDLVRVDHFRGFDEYYAIPYGDATAEYGPLGKRGRVSKYSGRCRSISAGTSCLS